MYIQAFERRDRTESPKKTNVMSRLDRKDQMIESLESVNSFNNSS